MSSSAIFREYIGVKPVPALHKFPDIVSKNVKEFHFILGIGTENYKTDGKGTGHFNCTWNVEDFNKERVREIKDKYSNVKVILSFGGLGKKNPFDPCEKNLWISQAYASIKGIIQKYYHPDQTKSNPTKTKTIIDGIDINYEYITPDDRFVFTSCIGELITKLKKDSDLSLNTFSISPSELVQYQYESLYFNYSDTISWINYQFYLHHVSPPDDDFATLFNKLVINNIFPHNKLLPGGTTDPNYVGNLEPNVFIEGITELNNANPLAGAFVWNANDSSVPPNPFYLEKIIQQILSRGVTAA